MKRIQASGGQNPDTGEAQDKRRADGAIPSPARFCQCWGCRRHGREDGVPSGESGVCLPLFSFFFSPPFSLTETHTPCFSDLSSPFSLINTPTTILFLSLCLSVGSPTLPPQPHLSALGSVETPALPNQRCQKWGHDFWTEDMGHAPCAPPPPAPPDGFYYLIRSSS